MVGNVPTVVDHRKPPVHPEPTVPPVGGDKNEGGTLLTTVTGY